MSWVTIVWSMIASACLTLAAMHLLVWSRRRTAWANLIGRVGKQVIKDAGPLIREGVAEA